MTETTWAPTGCALPTTRRPVREQQFGELFRTALRAVRRPAPERAELLLDPAGEATARDLAARESSCCSFFDFAFVTTGDTVLMTIEVPSARTAVLDALVESARHDAGLPVLDAVA